MNCFCRPGIRHAGRAQLEKLKPLVVLGAASTDFNSFETSGFFGKGEKRSAA